MKYTIEVYEAKNKTRPFDDWRKKLDNSVKHIITAKLERIALGNFSTCKSLGDGISEIKMDVGPGYRIYYAVVGLKIVLLLCAGDKRTQKRDIEKAKEYLQDYKERGRKHGKK